MEGAEKGPGGTVPILRQDLKLLSNQQTLKQRLSKPAPPRPGEKKVSVHGHTGMPARVKPSTTSVRVEISVATKQQYKTSKISHYSK
jgi:hypothetical protein